MAVNIPGPVTVATSGQTPVVTVPNGVCTVYIHNNDAANFVTIGDKNVTAGHGYKLTAGATLTFSTYPGSTGTPLYAVADTGAVVVSSLISTAQ